MQSPLIESILDKYADSVTWEYVHDLQLSTIDKQRSHKNQARIGQPLIGTVVEDYANAYKQGDEFPAIVVYPDGRKNVVMDGNHRHAGAERAGKTTHDAYVVVTDDPSLRLMLTFEFNRVLTGRTPEAADLEHQAIFLVNQGIDREDIGRHLRMSTSKIDALVRESKARDRARTLSVEVPFMRVPSRDSRLQLARLQLDPVFVAAVKVAGKYQLNITDVKNLVADLLMTGTEAVQLAKVAEVETKHRELAAAASGQSTTTKKRKLKPSSQNPRHLFFAHITAIIKTDPTMPVAGMDASERRDAKQKITAAIESLEKALHAIT